MSQYKAEPVRVLDPVMSINPQRKLAVVSGAKQTTYYQNITQSWSQSQITYSVTPSSNCVVDTRMFLKWTVQFVFAGTDLGSPLLQLGLNDSIRAYPISQVINSANMTINGSSVSITLSDMIGALAHYINLQEEMNSLSGTATMLDQFQQYDDWKIYGSGRNPMAYYGENSFFPSRGAINTTVVSNTNTAATVNVEIIEPVFLPPCQWGRQSHPGFAGIQNFTLQLNLGNLTRMWSHNSAARAFTSMSATLLANPELHYRVLTPNQDIQPYDPSHPYAYPCFNLVPQSTNVGSVASGASLSASTGVVTLHSIPSRFYLFVRRRNEDQDYTTSDVFARIDKVQISWNNRDAVLGAATNHDLYEIAVKNGLQDSYPQFSNYNGSVCCFEFGRDIGLDPNESVGLGGNYQLQCQVTFKNMSNSSINYSIYIVPVIPQIFVLQGSNASLLTNLITEEDIKMARESSATLDYLDGEEPFGGIVIGGSFLGKIWSGIKKGAKWVGKKAVPFIAKNAGKLANTALDLSTGNYMGAANDLYGLAKGSGMRGRRRAKGGLLIGGCAECNGTCEGGCMDCQYDGEVAMPMNRNTLLSRLQEYQ